MRKVNRSHKTLWSFKENDTTILLDICRLTISLNTGSDRHQNAMGISETFDEFLDAKSTIKNYLSSYNSTKLHAEEIIASIKHYNSDDYFNTITPEEFLNFEKYNIEKAIYIKNKFPQVINFKSNIDQIKKLNNRSAIALAIFILVLLTLPSIWSFYNIKALYFLVASGILSLFLFYLLLKVRKYNPKYGKAEIIEVYQSKSSLPNKNLFPLIYIAKVKAHKVYEFKNDFIDIHNFQEFDVTNYQIPTNYYTYLKDKDYIEFLTRGGAEIFMIIN